MKKLIFVIAVIFLINITNQEIFSQKRDGQNKEHFRMELKEKLNLTEEQENKLESLKLNQEEAVIKLRAELELKELEVRKLLSKDNISRNEMLSITKEINAIKDEMALARVNHQMDVYDILDQNQRKIWIDLQEKVCHMRNKMRGRMMDRMQEPEE